MSMDVHDLTAAYALDALDADETRARTRSISRAASAAATSSRPLRDRGALAFGGRVAGAAAALRARILDAARGRTTERRPAAAALAPGFRATAAAAACACAALGLGIWAAALAFARPRAGAGCGRQASQILADPASRKIALRGGTGRRRRSTRRARRARRPSARPARRPARSTRRGSSEGRQAEARGHLRGRVDGVVPLDRPVPRARRRRHAREVGRGRQRHADAVIAVQARSLRASSARLASPQRSSLRAGGPRGAGAGSASFASSPSLSFSAARARRRSPSGSSSPSRAAPGLDPSRSSASRSTATSTPRRPHDSRGAARLARAGCSCRATESRRG